MIWLDWLILAIVTYNVFSGFFSGLFRSLVNVAALICAFLLTPVLKGLVSEIVAGIFQIPSYLALPIGSSLTWAGIYVLISSIGLFWGKVISKTPLKIVDRLGGLALGLLISALLVLVPLAAVQSLPMLANVAPVQNTLRQSLLVPLLEPAVAFVRFTVGPSIVNYWIKQHEQQEMKQELPGGKASAKPGQKPAQPAAPAKAKPVPQTQPR